MKNKNYSDVIEKLKKVLHDLLNNSKRDSKGWVKTGLIVLAILFSLSLLKVIIFGPSRPSQANFQEVPVVRSKLEITIKSTGTVQPENRLEIKAPIAGRVDKVLVNEGEKVKKGQVLAWMSSTERAALLDAASAKGAAELDKWQKLYKSTPILAPINGTIIQRNVESGQTFTTQDAILVMSDRLTLKAQVDETDIARIKVGQQAKIILDAYSKHAIPSRVDKIAYDAKAIDNVTTYLVDVLPDHVPDFMRSGMTANVTFYVAERENALLVPSEALQSKNEHTSVLVTSAESRGMPEERQIEIGLSDGRRVEVLSGLAEKDVVLVPAFRRVMNQSARTPAGQSREIQ